MRHPHFWEEGLRPSPQKRDIMKSWWFLCSLTDVVQVMQTVHKNTQPLKDENKSPRLRYFNNLAYKCPSHLSNRDKEHHVSLKPRAPLCEVWAQSERKPQMAQRYKYDSRTDWHPPKWTKTVLKTMSASRYLHLGLLIFTTLAAKAHAGNPWTKQKSKQTNKNTTNFYGWFIWLVSWFTH